MRRLLALVAVGFALTVASPASASVLYSQPADGSGNAFSSQNDTNGGGFGNFATVYDNFSLAGTSNITSVQWTGQYFNPPAQGTITGFTVAFWADSAGQPGGLLSSQTVAGTANETFLNGAPTFTYDLTLPTAFTAQGGTQYWMSIVPDVGFPPQWGWSSGSGGDGSSVQDFFGNRSAIGSDLAFTLNGNAVPEPATLAVFGLIAVCGGLGLRRRMQTV